MRITCLICSDLFDGVNSQAATQCGHVFHEICLLQWLDKSKTCPSCRQHVSAKNLIRLYFDISDEQAVSLESLENEVETLKATCKQKDMDKRKLQEQMDLLREFVLKAEQERDSYKQKYLDKKSLAFGIQAQFKDLMKETAELRKVSEENLRLHNQIKHLQNIQQIIDGSVQDIEEMFQDVQSDSSGHLREMATYCVILKKEFLNLSELKNNLKNEVRSLKKELSSKSIQISDMRTSMAELSNAVAKHQMTIESLEKEKESLCNKIKSWEGRIADPSSQTTNMSSQVLSNSSSTVSSDRKRAPFDMQDTDSPQECSSLSPRSSENTPIVAKRIKINMVSSFKTNKCKPAHVSSSKPILGHSLIQHPSLPTCKNTSQIRDGYNGLGGHSRFISRSIEVQKKKPTRFRKGTL